MQIRIIIDDKYYSFYKKKKNKSATIVKKEDREFWYLFLQIKRETPNFKNPSKIKGYR
jgi:hypothetical protein